MKTHITGHPRFSRILLNVSCWDYLSYFWSTIFRLWQHLQWPSTFSWLWFTLKLWQWCPKSYGINCIDTLISCTQWFWILNFAVVFSHELSLSQNVLKKQRKVLEIYRILQILTISFNEAGLYIVAYGTATSFIGHVLSNAAILKLFRVLPLLNVLVYGGGGSAIFAFGEAAWFSTAGRLFNDSEAVIRMLRNSHNAEIRKSSRSCRRLYQNCGGFYPIVPSTLLSIWNNLVDKTITITLLFWT